MIHVVLLSGGSGTRLWPLSNNARSKQFLKVLRDKDGRHVSMVQRVFAQIENVPADIDITIATAATQVASLEMQVGGRYKAVVEPERRDTAPAIMLACANLEQVQGADPNDTVVVMPIDTFAEQEYYDRIAELDDAVQKNCADLVLLGVKPTYPSEKYGYIIPADAVKDGIQEVLSFKEKPSAEDAAEFINQGGLWNCGVFAFRLSYVARMPSSKYGYGKYHELLEHYAELPKISFDYEVVENAASIGVVTYEGTWKDLGTWNTLSDEMAEQCSGRVVMDEGTCVDTYAINETVLPMVVSGVEGAVVIATHDGILVTSREASADASLKTLINNAAATRPMYERRKWGEYRVLDASLYPDGKKSLTKELVVEAGKQLSYQKHHLRSEIWTVAAGAGEVVLDGKVKAIAPGATICISPEQMHSVRAFEDLHIVEVQLGSALIEDDIERFGNFWED